MSGADTRWDVLIVGGGPVGACAGALLQRAGGAARRPLRIGLLEPARPAPPAAGTALDARVSAWSRSSERILSAAGAWQRMAAERIQPYERMCVWPAHMPARSADALRFDAAYVGESNLGSIAENRLVQCAVLDAFEAAGGTILPGGFSGLEIHEDEVQVRAAEQVLSCKLLVGADGACSRVRDALGVATRITSYEQTAIVANVRTERAHERTAWQRFLGAGTLAFLPLADGSSSIVWSVQEALARERLALPAAQFEQELLSASDGVLGALELCTQRVGLPLRRLRAERLSAARCALLGDAAHVVHPLAGQGVNLGLLDAAALADCVLEALKRGEDPGAAAALRRYERWRKSELAPMMLAIDAFNRFLAHDSGPLAHLAQHGLVWVNRSEAAKRLFIGRALGLAGELPTTARVRAAAFS
ncbi:MAG: FAD-dependent monooxygenase [Steroidobacteraceae bacterium]